MKFARTKNTLRNIAFGSLDRVINIILPFASRTVILYVMGSQYLGLSSLFTSILSFLSLTELGIGIAMVYSMYKPIAENDHPTICALLNLYKKLYRIIGTIVLVLGLSLIPFLKILVHEELPPDIKWKISLQKLKAGAVYDVNPSTLNKQLKKDNRKPNPLIRFAKRAISYIKRRILR
jgi:hypothetical protein